MLPMNARLPRLAGLLLLLAAGFSHAAGSGDADARAAGDWRAERLSSLTAETGWLTLVGLYWLKDGPNTLGRARSSAIAIDNEQLGKRAGTFTLAGRAIQFAA